MITSNDIAQLAIEKVKAKPASPKPFELKDLFVGAEWDAFTKGERTTAGRIFSSRIKAGEVPNVRVLESLGKNRHNRYIKD